ncbi:hypothetical protein D4R54_02210 [archaeon]|nr:MAG: hypothetical protein D4R54_02210 [archaeon]
MPLDVTADSSHKIGGLHVRRICDSGKEPEIDRMLVEALNESFAAILGEIPKKTVYDILEKKHAIAVNRIPERLNEFTTALETLFGVMASKVIVRIVVKRLYSKLGLTYVERPDWRLPDYVNEAKSRRTLFNDPAELSLMFGRPARS